MPVNPRRITDSIARGLPPPEQGYQIHWCPDTDGFGVRVGAAGGRAYVVEMRVHGKTVRRTLGKVAGRGAVSSAWARDRARIVAGELKSGIDQARIDRVARRQAQERAITLARAVEQYITEKRRGKDGLALKPRTKADYLRMVSAGGSRANGQPYADGMLYPLASRSIHEITAAQMRDIFDRHEKRSRRQATYAMQVLRAVLNWHGVEVESSPLSNKTPGRDRRVLAPTAGNPSPIPPERLHAWWNAASERAGSAGADGARLILLTGCRPGEVFGSKYEPGLLVRDVDLPGARLTLRDTKNRSDHKVTLSSQAFAIVKAHCMRKRAGRKVFGVMDPGKTLDAINAAAGTPGVTLHQLRHTFASVADELVVGYALKKMLNHTATGDVTGRHYVGKGEAQLRAAWQTVADFIAG